MTFTINNIITKDAEDIVSKNAKYGGVNVSSTYGIDQEDFSTFRNINTLEYGFTKRKFNLYLAGTHYNSSQNWTSVYQADDSDYSLWRNRANPNNDWQPGGELYGKVNFGKFKLKGRYVNLNDVATRLSYITQDTFTSQQRINAWSELSFNHQFSKDVTLEAKVFFDHIKYWLLHGFNPFEASAPMANEYGFGEEVTFRAKKEKHNFIAGIRHKRMQVEDPVIDSYNGGIDNVIGVYAEDYLKLNKKINLLAGLRADYNDLRDNGGVIFLPRFSAFYFMNKKVTLKYLFNSGYIRPAFKQNLGGRPNLDENRTQYTIGAQNSERVYNNELVVQYKSKSLLLRVVPYFTLVDNYISWVGQYSSRQFPDSLRRFFSDRNIGSIESRGVEVEVAWEIGKVLMNCNYTFVDARMVDPVVSTQDYTKNLLNSSGLVAPENNTLTGSPPHMWNVSANYSVKNFNIYLGYRGHSNIWAKRAFSGPLFEKFGSMTLFNSNITYSKNKYRVGFYVKNILDRRDRIPLAILGGYTFQYGRRMGVTASLQF